MSTNLENRKIERDIKRLDWLIHTVGFLVTLTCCSTALLLWEHSLADEQLLLTRRMGRASQLLANAVETRAVAESHRIELAQRELQWSELIARIPDAPQESEFLAQLSGLARETGMEIREYHPESTFATDTHVELEIALRADGSYGSLCRFLDGVEALPRLCRVTQLDVSTSDEPSESYPVNMKLRLFFTPEQKSSSDDIKA